MVSQIALSPHFKRVVDALLLVSPFCVAARFEDGFRHCVEVSSCGAAALARRKIKAHPVPCAVLALGSTVTADTFLSIGLNRRQLYDLLDGTGVGPVMPFETWVAEYGDRLPDDDTPHEIIRAQFGGQSAFIDLTIGQLRQTGAADPAHIPLNLASVGAGWPRYETTGGAIAYMKSPHGGRVIESWNRKVNSYINKSFVDDIDALIELALACNLDQEAVYSELRRQQPEMFDTCMTRMSAWGVAG